MRLPVPLVLSALGIGLLVLLSPGTAPAQQPGPGPFDPRVDHLKCYEVIRDAHEPDQVPATLLSEQFGKEQCRVLVKAKYFCAPVAKCLRADDCDDEDFPGLNPRIDYTCYKVTCAEPVTRKLKIEDQFGERNVAIRSARLLCAPTVKH